MTLVGIVLIICKLSCTCMYMYVVMATTIFQHCTGQLGSEWVLLGVTNNSQRGDSERIRDKNDLKEGVDITGLMYSYVSVKPQLSANL